MVTGRAVVIHAKTNFDVAYGRCVTNSRWGDQCSALDTICYLYRSLMHSAAKKK